MKGIQLDLTGCKGYYELHERIRQAFNFPNFYGHNWRAFWDLLWSECDADRVEMTGEDERILRSGDELVLASTELYDGKVVR